MKIYYFSGAVLPSQSAQSVHVMKMCAALSRQGHDVTLFAKGPHGSVEDLFSFYGVMPTFQILKFLSFRVPILDGVWRLLNILFRVRHKPDLIYGRDLLGLSLFCTGRIPVVYEAHQVHKSLFLSWILLYLIKSPCFLGVVCISQALKSDFLRQFPQIPHQKIFVAHDAADLPTRMLELPELKGRTGSCKVGYAGSLHPGKGGEHLLVLAQMLLEFDFHVFGGSETQIRALKIKSSDNLIFYGHVPHAEIQEYLSACDILVAPYQQKIHISSGADIARWISPLKLFEYMSAGKPIVCSRLPVLEEILSDRENALLIDPEDFEAWKSALVELWQNKDFSENLAKAAYENFCAKYTWDARAMNIIDFIQSQKYSKSS